VAELAGADGLLTQSGWCPTVLSLGVAGAVDRFYRRGYLWRAGKDFDHDPRTAVYLECADGGGIAFYRDPESGESVGHTSHVVGIVSADAQLDQPASGALCDVELFATVGRRKARAVSGQAEFGIVPTGVLDVGNADGDR
jgi:hypothetical protein